MRTGVEFRTTKFPSEDPDGEVNPGRYGKRLAEFLWRQLPLRGIATREPYAEDWGWVVPVVNEAFSLWIGCGNLDDCADGFLCFIEPSKPFVRRFLRRIDTTAKVALVADALDQILAADPEIHSVRWRDDCGGG